MKFSNALLALAVAPLLTLGQDSQPSEIWQQLAGIEGKLHKAINEEAGQTMIFSSDPVRGYHIPGVGITVMVPVRYQVIPTTEQAGENALNKRFQRPSTNLPDKRDLERKIRKWRQELQKRTMLKEANLERVASLIKARLPEIVADLPSLPSSEAITIIIEEREPVFLYSVVNQESSAKRQVVTLRISAPLIAELRNNHQDHLDTNWSQEIQRNDAFRVLATTID